MRVKYFERLWKSASYHFGNLNTLKILALDIESYLYLFSKIKKNFHHMMDDGNWTAVWGVAPLLSKKEP